MMEKYCPHCETTLPLANFNKNRCRSDGVESQCRECRKALRGNPTGNQLGAWTDAEDDVLWRMYAVGGAARMLPGRSLAAIYQRAHRLGVMTEARESAERLWVLPQQDSAADHLLFQRTPMPVFARGNLSPRLAA